MGGESTAAWSSFLADLDARGLPRPEFVIVDGAPGLALQQDAHAPVAEPPALLCISSRISGLSGGLSRRTVFGSTPIRRQARR